MLGSTVPASAQAVLRGVVREDSSNRPLARVEVLVEGTKRLTTTDTEGRFVLGDLPSGLKVALFRLVGYRPVRNHVRLAKGDTAVSEASMVREGVRLAPIEVTGAVTKPRGIGLEAFEERRRLGFGRFMDSTELRRADNMRMGDLLARLGAYMVPYQEILPGGRRGIQESRAASTRRQGGPDGATPCWMGVMVDGVVRYRGMATGTAAAAPPPDFRREFEPTMIVAIEVYRSAAETPMEFGGSGAQCGMIILWTRR